MKAVEAKEKDEDRLKLSQSNSKAVVTCMEDLTAKFGWSVITSKIDGPKDPGNNLVNIFTSIISLKLDHVDKKSYQHWGPDYGNDFPDILSIFDIDPGVQDNDHPLFFVRVYLEMIEKGI